MKIVYALGASALLAVAGFAAAAVAADGGSAGTDHVTICHATGHGEAFVLVSASAAGIYAGHVAHHHGDDIIPAFSFTDGHGNTVVFDGQNLDAAYGGVLGRSMLLHGCSSGGDTTTDDGDTTEHPPGTTTSETTPHETTTGETESHPTPTESTPTHTTPTHTTPTETTPTHTTPTETTPTHTTPTETTRTETTPTRTETAPPPATTTTAGGVAGVATPPSPPRKKPTKKTPTKKKTPSADTGGALPAGLAFTP